MGKSRPGFVGAESAIARKLAAGGFLPRLPNNQWVSEEWINQYGFIVDGPGGKIVHGYVPTPKGLDFHESIAPNCVIEGSRGTGKSTIIRNDAHMRALAYPGYNYLIIRRTMPELKRSHLRFIDREMLAFGAKPFNKTDGIAYYPNGSTGFFAQCEDEAAMLKLLSSEYCAIYFDEITTFSMEMITKVSSCVRVPEGSGLLAIVRGGTNPIGIGADYVRRAYITKDIAPEEDPEYLPDEYESIHTTLDDNPFIDKDQYIRRLSSLPDHVRRAWLFGEWAVEGAYFHDFYPTREHQPWHVTDIYPQLKDRRLEPMPWLQIYRAVDWGFSPDPAVCLWIVVLPNSRAFVLKERTWKAKTAQHVARCIREESDDMRISATFADPTMFFGSEATGNNSVGDIFEANGVPLDPVKNDREHAGYAIHEYLNTLLSDGLPKLQIYGPDCPKLVKTLPEMRTHKLHPERIADGNDHWTIALAYFCMSNTGVSKESFEVTKPLWLRPKKAGGSNRMGAESVRRAS